MRFFLLRSATCPDESRRFQPPSTLSHTDPWKSGRTPTDNHIRTWQPHLAIPQDGILPFFPQRCFESKQIKVIRLQMSSKNWLHVIKTQWGRYQVNTAVFRSDRCEFVTKIKPYCCKKASNWCCVSIWIANKALFVSYGSRGEPYRHQAEEKMTQSFKRGQGRCKSQGRRFRNSAISGPAGDVQSCMEINRHFKASFEKCRAFWLN